MNLDKNEMDLGGGLVLHSTAVEPNAGFKKVSETYNEFAKLVFLFDVSGSMNARIVTDSPRGESYINEFIWPDGRVTEIGVKTGEVLQKINALLLAGDPMYLLQLQNDELEYTKLFDEERGSLNEFLFTPADDDGIKARVVKTDLTGFLGILPDITKKHQEPPTRIGVVRKLAKQEIHRRFKMYPRSRVAVIPFSECAAPLFDDGKEDDIDAAIDRLACQLTIKHDNGSETVMDGGTHIMNGIAVGMQVCAAKPSDVGIHHFIVISDGEDSSTYDIPQWIPNMKASGIVLDYIHIGDSQPNDRLKAACKALGGECVTVNSEKDLETKFFQAATRLLAPPSTVK
jgi:hypothetical protein